MKAGFQELWKSSSCRNLHMHFAWLKGWGQNIALKFDLVCATFFQMANWMLLSIWSREESAANLRTIWPAFPTMCQIFGQMDRQADRPPGMTCYYKDKEEKRRWFIFKLWTCVARVVQIILAGNEVQEPFRSERNNPDQLWLLPAKIINWKSQVWVEALRSSDCGFQQPSGLLCLKSGRSETETALSFQVLIDCFSYSAKYNQKV